MKGILLWFQVDDEYDGWKPGTRRAASILDEWKIADFIPFRPCFMS